MCIKKTKAKVQLNRSQLLKMKAVEMQAVLLEREFPLHFGNNLVDDKFFGDEPNKVWKALLLSPQATLGYSINDQMEIAWEKIKI